MATLHHRSEATSFQAHVGTTYKRALLSFRRFVTVTPFPPWPSWTPRERLLGFHEGAGQTGRRQLRKPRDIDAELRALQDKAKTLKARKVVQLGELVTATGADALDAETLAGVLLAALDGAKQPNAREGWRQRGAAFFQRRARSPKNAGESAGDNAGSTADSGGHGAS
jgi:hypothetical protein